MTDLSKIKPSHLARAAFVYMRQSTPAKSSTIVNPLPANTLWPIVLVNWVGPNSKWS
jgi:hypothetical protein